MGTTRDTLTTDAGAQVRFVVAIQGYDRLLTNHDNAAAVVTAWSGTDWSQALTGLALPGPIRQSIQPFRPTIEAETLQLVVYPDESETFASTVFATEKSSGNACKLNPANDLTSNGTTVNITGSNSGFASSGYIHIGTEAISYGGKTSLAFTGCSRGRYSPFGRNTSTRFGKPHKSNQEKYGTTVASPWVTDYPRVWVGRHVGVWAHVLRGSVLDTKAEAELIWAGTIADITEDEQGRVVMSCLDARDMIRSAVLFHDQFTAKPIRGAYLPSGERIFIRIVTYDGSSSAVIGHEFDTFTIGTDETTLVPGDAYTTADDLVSALESWLRSGDGTTWHDNGTTRRLPLCFIHAEKGQFQLWVNCESNGDDWRVQLDLEIEHPAIGHLLGWMNTDFVGKDDSFVTQDWDHQLGRVSSTTDPAEDPPARIAAPRAVGEYIISVRQFDTDAELHLGEKVGPFVNQRDQLPALVYGLTDSTGKWGIVDLAGQGCALVRMTDAEQDLFDRVILPKDLLKALGYEGAIQPDYTWQVYRRGEAAPLIRQMFWVAGDGKDLIPKLVASTGTSGYNHATYDEYPYSLGAGVPWALLGDDFLSSCSELFNGADAPMSLLIEAPTKLADLIAPELALRNAHLVFRDGKMVFLSPSFASPLTATHGLTEHNKAAAPDRQAENRSRYGVTRAHLVNHIKVLYGRRLTSPGQDAEYREILEISNEQSKTDYGIAQPVTVQARNHISENVGGDTIRQLAIDLAASALSEFARPILEVQRSYDVSLFPMVPGDTCTLTDSHVRDPETGTRGIDTWSAWVLATEWNWATTTGRVTLALTDHNRRTVYSPAAQVDDTADSGGFASGYSSATSTLRCYANEHSFSGQADAGFFEAGEEIEITELSPADPASPVRWTRTIQSVSGNDITLTSALSSPSWDDTLKYRVTSVRYADADATQQPDAYLADDADAHVQDARRPYTWAKQGASGLVLAVADSTRKHEYPVLDGHWDSEGYPVHPGMHRACIDTVNNLVDYKTAPCSPIVLRSGSPDTTTSATYVVVGVFQTYIGDWTPGTLSRKLYISPILSISASAATVSCRVTTSSAPPTGTGMTATLPSLSQSVEFTHTGDTNATAVTAQAIDVVRNPADPCCYVTVEIKVTGGELIEPAPTASFYGLTRVNLGPQE